jgi:hypothetical protein
MTTPNHDIFLSYNGDDTAAVEHVARWLQDETTSRALSALRSLRSRGHYRVCR